MKMNDLFKFICCCIILTAFLSCEEEKSEPESNSQSSLFTKMSSEHTGVAFNNRVENQKDFNIFKYRNFYNGGGVALGDINNDGLIDIYFTANMDSNKLYLNKGDFKFEDITESAGVAGNKPWSTGVNMIDVNSDGLLDIYVSNAGNMEGNNHDNDLYINNGDLTFTEQAKEFNLAETGFSTHASFLDYDKDGDLDAYILNNSNIPVTSLGYADQRELRAKDWDVPHIFRGVGDMLLRNDGDVFTDVSEEAGIYGSLIGFGLGVMVTDINNDLYPDIYVSNDFYERDYLYINNQDGTFTEDIKNWTSHLCLSAMGIDMADINNDGLADIFITDMLPEPDPRVKSVMEFEGYNVFKLKQSKDFYQQYIQNTLQLNNGNGSFSEIAYFSGVSATDWSWSGLLFDMDNDGYRDIFVTNGVNHDLTDLDFVDFFANEIIQEMALTGRKEAIDSIIDKMPVVPVPNYAYRNNKDLTFDNVADEWGVGGPSLSNGAAYGDLDNDGDLDLVVNNVNSEAFVYKNNSTDQNDYNYIQLQFKGDEKNPFAIGTRVKLYHGEHTVLQELIPSRGFQSSMDYKMTIGLGESEKIDSIEVLWPNDRVMRMANIDANQLVELSQDAATDEYSVLDMKKSNSLLEEVATLKVVGHQENPYNDFDYVGLINQQLSQEGPAMAIGDINGDGNEDVYLGGSSGQAGSFAIHNGGGDLTTKTQPDFITDAGFEDTAAALFDADGDEDLDLLVGCGGNEVGSANSFQNRLYINDGNGNFSKSEDEIPTKRHNVSVIAPHDFDGDGDVDVFVGSRSVVGVYGIDPEHLFLENQGDGTFRDATERLGYDLKDAGMITSAQWADTDGDGKKDLVTVSEWGSPKIYKNNGRRLSLQDSSLAQFTGWWNTIQIADLDGDGDQDIILGNQGENIHYKPSPENPMRIWINDFDNNGTIEQVMTQTIEGRDMPLHQKREIVNQMVSLKKQNLKASEYARKSVQDLFTQEVIDNSIMKEVAYSSSMILINEGGNSFSSKALPTEVQLSCVCGISCTDVNNDGMLDLVMGGNNFEFKPQYSRLDASYGNVLINKGDLEFEWQSYDRSGLFIKNEVKHMGVIKDANGNSFIVTAINDDKPKVFRINEKAL